MANAAKIVMTEGDAPASPDAGTTSIYFKTDHILYKKDHDGTESSITSYTHPNHSGDVTSAADGAQTIAAKAVDVAMLADGTDGELITWGADGVATTVAVGTATHVLTSNGAGAAPTFQAAAGGSGHIIEEETTPLTARASLRFTGAGVTATDDAGNNVTIVTIPGGAGGGDFLVCQVFT
jgi:hypothetical protein